MEKKYKYEAKSISGPWKEITKDEYDVFIRFEYNDRVRVTEADNPSPSQIIGDPGILDFCYKTMQERVNNGWNAESVFAAFKLCFRKELTEIGLDADYDASKFKIE